MLVQKTEWRRYDNGMEPQGEEERLGAAEKGRTHGWSMDVQTVGLNAETKKCRHRARGKDFSLDIHSYRTFLEREVRNDGDRWRLLPGASKGVIESLVKP